MHSLRVITLVAVVVVWTSQGEHVEAYQIDPLCRCRSSTPGIPGQKGDRGPAGPEGSPGPQKLQYINEACSVPNTGSVRYNAIDDVVQYCNGQEWISLLTEHATSTLGESKANPASSCLALSKLAGYKPGVYWIKPSANRLAYKVYCKEGGWTLIMKVDGAKQTFHYDSSFWTSTFSYNKNSVYLDDNEAKLASFWTLPFNEVLLGLKTNGETNWVTFRKSASSLGQIIASGKYHSTSIGRSAWKSLIDGSSLQPNCNREGFNVKEEGRGARVRIGIFSNNENDCKTADSWLGVGGRSLFHGQCGVIFRSNSCGNQAACNPPDNGNKNVFSMGYVFAR